MNRENSSPRRRRRSVAALLPAALLGSLLVAAPFVGQPLASPGVTLSVGADRTGARGQAGAGVRVAAPEGAQPAAAQDHLLADQARPATAPANRPGWSVSRGAVGVLVLSYVGIGALAAAGIWSYLRRGRW